MRRTLNAKLKALQDELREINGELSSRSEVELERRLIKELAVSGGNVSATARALGVFPIQVRRWCRRLQIDVKRYRVKRRK